MTTTTFLSDHSLEELEEDSGKSQTKPESRVDQLHQ
ncbi:unnamed protein product [Amoebophrya sp. A25]|nr:unnamed protein product [Amoebophrya sp. A25]|eukprot:GSA25T00011000001.1